MSSEYLEVLVADDGVCLRDKRTNPPTDTRMPHRQAREVAEELFNALHSRIKNRFGDKRKTSILRKDILKIANARPPQIKTDGGICEDKNPNKSARTKKDMLNKINRTVKTYIQLGGVVSPLFDISGMNYQQRNRALFECIREPCVRTGGNRNGASGNAADITANLMFNA